MDRGSQIPAFGNWEYVNDLPITQYFECARQAGLGSGFVRYSSEGDPHLSSTSYDYSAELYAAPHKPPSAFLPPPPRPKYPGKGRDKRGGSHAKEGTRKGAAGKVFDVNVTELPPPAAPTKRHPPAVNAVKKQQQQQQLQHDAGLGTKPRRAPKAVDEDLYKIPPELLKRKRRLGFISRCLVPPCAV